MFFGPIELHRVPTSETPFNIAFGTKAMILLKLGLPSFWVENFHESSNSEHLWANLDLPEEIQEQATVRMMAYRQRVTRYHDTRVRGKLL